MKKPNLMLIARSWQTYAVLVVTLLAMCARLRLWHFESGDYINEISRWYDVIREAGFRAFRDNFFPPYTPLYLYLLYVCNALLPNLPKLLSIKMISVIFDLVCALYAYKLVRLKYPTGSAPLFAFTAILLAPTVVWNGSLWAQCDALYTGGLLVCVYLLASHKRVLAFVAYGFALALKLQAIFLAPFLVVLLLKRVVSWKCFLLVPIVYVVTILPAWFAGRSFVELLTIHFGQTNFYQSLSMSAPNVYQWFPESLHHVAYYAGLVWTATMVALFCLLVSRSRIEITTDVMIRLATVSVLVVPFFLPRMHERYFFAADVLSIVFAFYFPRFFFVPVAVQMVSFFSYFPFLFGYQVIPLSVLAFALLVTIVVLVGDLAQMLYQKRPMPCPT